MGEIADMMLDGTMDPETGEFNFDGENGPGFPMTGAEAEQFKRATRYAPKGAHGSNARNARRRAAKRARKAAS
jgi:hypothetical protein